MQTMARYEDRIKFNFSNLTPPREAVDAASNVVQQSAESNFWFLPNHVVDEVKELHGFMLDCHEKEKSFVLPIGNDLFKQTCVYEIKANINESFRFNPHVLHILNNLDTVEQKMKELEADLIKHSSFQPTFSCIPDNKHYIGDAFVFDENFCDQETWFECPPTRFGIYHAFTNNQHSNFKEHKLFIAVTGHLQFAAEALRNLWLDTRNDISCEEFVETEEVNWLRSTTRRNLNRIAARIAKKLDLPCMTVTDMMDPEQSRLMLMPTNFSYHNDIKKEGDRIKLVRGASFTNDKLGGVILDTQDWDGYWIFLAPPDTEYCNFDGTYFSCRGLSVFPTELAFYNEKKDVPVAAATSIVHLGGDKSAKRYVQKIDENFFACLEKLGFDRNDGIVNLMPLISITKTNLL